MATRPLQQPPTDEDVLNPKVSASALDFLLIELVPLAQRITEQLLAREKVLMDEYRRSRDFNRTAIKSLPTSTSAPNAAGETAAKGKTSGQQGDAAGGVTAPAMNSLGFPSLSNETRQGILFRLDKIGYRVGQGLVERFTIHSPRSATALDSIKYICKDLWTLLWRKQIDNLKTNHRGIFVLTDTRFQPLSRVSVDRRAVQAMGGTKAAAEALERAGLYLYFPCGVIRGALAGLGLEATVEGSTTEIPTAVFQIKTKGYKA